MDDWTGGNESEDEEDFGKGKGITRKTRILRGYIQRSPSEKKAAIVNSKALLPLPRYHQLAHIVLLSRPNKRRILCPFLWVPWTILPLIHSKNLSQAETLANGGLIRPRNSIY